MAVALIYFAYLAAMALGRGAAAGGRLRPLAVALLALALIGALGMAHVMPLVYLLLGYWLPASLAGRPDTSFERRLASLDDRLFGRGGIETFARRAPRVLVEYFELSYLMCYAIVPVGFAWLVWAGAGDRAGVFWSAVLLASFLCYGVLPWLPTRAPRALERPGVPRRSFLRRLNVYVLDRASVQWNTFPSGHTAASVATALAVGAEVPVAGAILGAAAVSIAVGSVLGRYHYAADAIAGAIVAAAAFVMASAAYGP